MWTMSVRIRHWSPIHNLRKTKTMKKLITLVLIMLTGCVGTLPEPGLSDRSKTEVVEDSVSQEVTALLAAGAASMTFATGATVAASEYDTYEVALPLTAFGAGVILWGAAGITYLIQSEEQEK